MEQYRKTPRAEFLDYDGGEFFVTICTKERKHYFGEIMHSEMYLSEIGKFVELQLNSASSYNDNIEVPLFVVMPNHVHAIVCVAREDLEDVCGGIDTLDRAPNPALRSDPTCRRYMPALSRYINSFKGAVTRYANSNGFDFKWQTRYHDHAIRGYVDRANIWEYISNNVSRWKDDRYFGD